MSSAHTHRFLSLLSSESRCEQFNIHFENTHHCLLISVTPEKTLTHSLTAVTKLYEFTHFFQTPKKPDPVLAVTVTPALASVCLGLLEISIPLSCYSAFLSAIKPLHQAPTAFSRGLPVGYDCLFLSLTVSSLNLCCRFWFELSWLIICESSQFHKSTWCWILQSNWK